MPHTPRARVLVLESEDHPLSELARLLDAQGILCDRDPCGEGAYIRATTARNAGAAHAYGCIVVDLDCTSFGESQYTPIALLESLRLSHFDVPFIAFTAYPDTVRKVRCVPPPCTVLIRDPDDLEDFSWYLHRRIRSMILSAPQPT